MRKKLSKKFGIFSRDPEKKIRSENRMLNAFQLNAKMEKKRSDMKIKCLRKRREQNT